MITLTTAHRQLRITAAIFVYWYVHDSPSACPQYIRGLAPVHVALCTYIRIPYMHAMSSECVYSPTIVACKC